jgi:hypothetical protein
MLVKIISVPFETVLGAFDDTALRDFIKDKEVLSVETPFFVRNASARSPIHPGPTDQHFIKEFWLRFVML